MKFQLQKRI